MKKITICTLFMLLFFSAANAQNSLWNKTSDERLSALDKMDRKTMPSEYQLFSLNLQGLKAQLQQAPRDTSGQVSNVVIPFPDSDGNLKRFVVYEAPVMEDGLAAKFPEIKSYLAKGLDDTAATLRFSVTNFGLHVMSLSGSNGMYYIDTYTKDLNNYIVYNRKNIRNTTAFDCHTTDEGSLNLDRLDSNAALVNDGNLRQYRLVISCTVEYAAFHLNAAGTPAGAPLATKKAVVLSAMVVSMTRVNGVYERDMAIRMNLVANNDLVIFIDSDSYTNSPAMLNEIQPIVDAAIGPLNYDMGHGYCTTDSGIAQLASVCNPTGSATNGKARGITGQANPVGDPFDIDYVAHEMGHQWGASHTQNNNCNRSADSAFEPGSASTILGYAGICAPDVQSNSDAYFHARSLLQMTNFAVGSTTCGVWTANGNIAPVVDAGANYTIPFGTAFVLTGSATDANGDSLTYCWEQYNNQVSTQPPVATATTGPNFRSRMPSASPSRYMPVFSEVLNGNLVPTWEVVPNVARTMTFALTVRDNRAGGGMSNRDDMTVTFANSGPFRITSPSVENASWPLGSSQLLTWDVAGTTAAPISTANVRISYSTDGGATFTTLIASTPNDGSETITVPATLSTTARIMIESIGNIFYCVSKNIAFGYSITNTCNTYTDSTPLPFVDQAPGTYTTRTLNVPMTGVISDVNVINSITHTYLSDVQTDISSPQNPTTFVKLFNRSCGNTSGTVNLKFSDGGAGINCTAGGAVQQTVSPSAPLSAFNGQNPQGVWTFRVYDNYAGDTGTINNWAVEICTQTIALVNENFGLDQFVLYPNPNNGSFNIKFNSLSTNEIGVFVHDIRGREIFNKSYQNTGVFEQGIQLSSVQAGVYLVTVKDGDRKEVKKIIIE